MSFQPLDKTPATSIPYVNHRCLPLCSAAADQQVAGWGVCQRIDPPVNGGKQNRIAKISGPPQKHVTALVPRYGTGSIRTGCHGSYGAPVASVRSNLAK